ncbi:MAG TPA: hypothetical protein VG815_05250 [Chloroflexota bacterium]|nr:hypothetical protein [Chloroflexota bacterium]
MSELAKSSSLTTDLMEAGMNRDAAMAAAQAMFSLDSWPAPKLEPGSTSRLMASLKPAIRRGLPVARRRLVRACALGGIAAVLILATTLAASPKLRSTVTGWLSSGTTVRSPLVLGSVDFLNSKLGFVVVGNTRTHQGYLYKTPDAGRRWHLSLRFRTGGDLPNLGLLGTSLTFLNGQVGFLYTAYGSWGTDKPGVHIHGVLHRTVNGGRSWSRVKLPTEQWQAFASVSFVNRRQGWVLISSGTTMGQAVGALFRTENGGHLWTKIAWDYYTPNMTQSSRGGLGGSFNQRIHFISSRDGWLFSEDAVVGPSADSLTADGGDKWQGCREFPRGFERPGSPESRLKCSGPVPLRRFYTEALRSSGSDQVFVTQLDSGDFFNGRGLLPVVDVVPRSIHNVPVPPTQGGYFMYHLDRSPYSWVRPTPLPLGMPYENGYSGGPVVDVQSPRDWFFAGHGRIVYTLSAGTSWIRLPSPVSNSFTLGGVKFFGAKTGFIWGGSLNQKGPYSPRSVLDRTDDGGRTWTTVKLPVR